MTLEEIMDDVKLVISVGKAVVDIASEEAPYLQTAYALLFQHTSLNDAQRATLRAKQAALEAEILEPLAPEEEPDPAAAPAIDPMEDPAAGPLPAA